jgi:DNA-binding response OmpR family regulator
MAARVLYVDDEESLRMLVRSELSPHGYEVDIAEDGDVALNMLEQKTYDLVLLDIRMPRMDGIEVLNQMKIRNIRPRIIMLTGVDDLSVAVQSVKLGATDFITKPYDLEQLLSSIKRVLAR